MRKLLFAIGLFLSLAASAQVQWTPTGSRTRFGNGIAFSTKSDAYYGTVDSLVLYASGDSTLKFKYKGTARALAYAPTQGLNGYIPKWTSASGLDTSQIRQEGGNILIGGAPNNGYKVGLLGTIQVQGDAGFTGSLAVSSRLLSGGVTDDGIRSLQVNGSSRFTNYLYANVTKSNTADPSNYVGNLVGSGGYWAIRTATDNSFNIDTYNSGSALNAVKVEQDGIVTLANRIKSTQYRLSALNTAPSSASDTGTLGEIRITATYIYVCTATNTWVRTALATW